jgi:hypothetical protein
VRELIVGETKIKWAGEEEPNIAFSLWKHKEGTYIGMIQGCLWWKSPDGAEFKYGTRTNIWDDKDLEFIEDETASPTKSEWKDKHYGHYSCAGLEPVGELVKPDVVEPKDPTKSEWTDKHYDHYYTLTPEDIAAGKIKIDPYFVNTIWGINDADKTGAAFHNLKTLSRMAKNKNSLAREWDAMIGQSTRARQLMKGE